ncbi:homoserine kinase [Limosilactobacillus sp.]|uniref:homoserine kinase n=1 Tax=Limosilactobacillus sp. TaxID=2773925 RepID=UPI00345EB3A5
MRIIVPASSANLGPGFDSIGMAVNRYLTLTVGPVSKNWQVAHHLGGLPHDESNLIVKTALNIKSDLPTHQLSIESEVPLAHGLGSSATAVVAGVELANQLGHLNLSDDEKIELASQVEGHPDNAAPAILGGIVIGTNLNGHFAAVKAPHFPYSLAAYIPHYNLKTADARATLPEQLPYAQATHGSAIANTLVAALFAQRYDLVGPLLEADKFHEQYRAKLVPELMKIRQIGHQTGALATYLSGAGPTVMTLLKSDRLPAFQSALQQADLTDDLWSLAIDDSGVRVEG